MRVSPLRLRTCSLFWAVTMAALAFGCQRTARDLPLDRGQARQACETFLEAWRDGKQPADLRPDITGSDHQWVSGRKLVAYELLPEEFNDGTNLHISARLTLQDEKGNEATSNALYIVGTSPVVTVFRK